jgi:serine/threonine protein kinase
MNVDLTPTNVAFELPNIHSMSRTQLYQLLGDPKSEPLKLGNGSYSEHAPKRVIQTPNFPGLDHSSLSRVVIIDFGNAFFADSPPQSSGSPIDFFPPEICFGYSPSTKSDVWQLACVLYTIHAREPLFPTFFRIFEILVGTIVGFQGPLPQEWKGRFKFDEYGHREAGKEPKTTDPAWWFEEKQSEKTIDSRFSQHAQHLPTNLIREYTRLLHDMVAYEPTQRISAADAAQRLKSMTYTDDS